MYYRRLKFCIIYLALNRGCFEAVLMKNTPGPLGVKVQPSCKKVHQLSSKLGISSGMLYDFNFQNYPIIECQTLQDTYITFFKRGPADPSQQCKTASNSIQDPPPRWILTIFKLKFGGGNLFSPAMTSTREGNNYVGLLLKPLLKKVILVVGSRMLCKVHHF
jgi:hypothetical protein